jgi:hypothetical protein
VCRMSYSPHSDPYLITSVLILSSYFPLSHTRFFLPSISGLTFCRLVSESSHLHKCTTCPAHFCGNHLFSLIILGKGINCASPHYVCLGNIVSLSFLLDYFVTTLCMNMYINFNSNSGTAGVQATTLREVTTMLGHSCVFPIRDLTGQKFR